MIVNCIATENRTKLKKLSIMLKLVICSSAETSVSFN